MKARIYLQTLVMAALVAAAGAAPLSAIADTTLLNVSYDPTRELYDEYNKLFADYWKKKTGETVTIKQSHGGSGKQARSVIDGLVRGCGDARPRERHRRDREAGQAPSGRLAEAAPGEQLALHVDDCLPRAQGQPKGIKDWGDLAKEGVSVITPNPKTSGGARWNYLAAWAWALHQPGGSDEKAQEYLKKVFGNVPILDTGARGSTITFVQREIGDVLLAWENEALLAVRELGVDKLEIVVPSLSILAEPPVAVIDQVVQRRGTREAALAYLEYLYSKEAQEVIAKNYYRPRDPEIAAKYASQYPKVNLVTIEDFGGWDAAQTRHFGDGGTFDQIYAPQ
jgi:sulfate transport system substrate-binding protein